MLKRPSDVVREAGSYYGSNPHLLTSLAKQTADAWIGGALLALGFGAQLAQAARWHPAWSLRVILPAAGGFVLILWLLLAMCLRPWNVRRVGRLQLDTRLEGLREEEELKHWRGYIISGARTMGREIQPGERPVDLAIWAVGRKRWNELTAGLELPDDIAEPIGEG